MKWLITLMPLSLSALLSGKAVSLTSFTKNGTFASWKLAVLKRMKNMLPFEIKRDLYLPFIVPHFNILVLFRNVALLQQRPH